MRPPMAQRRGVDGAEQELRGRLARNVRARRMAAGLTLEEAAGRAGLSWRHWQKVEAAETSATLRTLARLAKGLGCEPGDLLAPAASRRA